MNKVFTHTLWKASLLATFSLQAQVADFENLPLAADAFWNGAPANHQPFESGDALFENTCTKEDWGAHWAKGFAYSNKTDISSPGYTNMYSAISGKGANGSSTYAVAQNNATIRFKNYPHSKPVTGLYITNGTYAALSMLHGDSFGKKFGGASGNDPDFFLLTIRGYANGQEIAQKIKFYLADFRNADNTKDYVVKTWKWVDLSTLGPIDSLKFQLSSSDHGDLGMNTPGFFCLDNFNQGYYPDKVGTNTTTAIHADSSIIKSWAYSAEISRGYLDISQKQLGLTTVGTPASASGKADGSVVSLGDSGSATLAFQKYIFNGQGPDFAVFENGLVNNASQQPFLELATVSVSSDGVHFYAFPAVSNTQDTAQVEGFASVDAKLLHNLAGKYQARYGTPFDLEDLKDVASLDINKISHVRITDVVGHIGTYATHDLNGNAINDPWNTPFASGGFDLDGVAVIHEGDVVSALDQTLTEAQGQVYPNPAKDHVYIAGYTGNVQLYTTEGTLVESIEVSTNKAINISHLNTGMYLTKIQGKVYKIIKE